MQEIYVDKKSIIHQYDARVKVIFTLAIIISLNLTPVSAWSTYIFYLTLVLSLTIISRINTGFIFKRSLLALPFILAALPLIFIGPLPHVAWHISPSMSISFSPEGFRRFVSITIRSWISIQAAILLAATTRFPDLLTAFQQLKVPKLFIAIIELMWRYLFIISDEVIRMIRARASRSAANPLNRSGGTVFWRGKVTGGMAGSLFLRSLERSDRVYSAMLSRGYNGNLPTRDIPPLSKKQWVLIILFLLFLFLLWFIGFVTGG